MAARHPLARRILMFSLLVSVGLASSSALAVDKIPSFELPLLITTAGQDMDWFAVAMTCKKIKLEYTANNLADVGDLKGVRTLIVAPGHSMKGLGSAGTDEDAELARVERLLAEAKRLGIAVVLVHVGGETRRAPTSHPFIEEVMAYPPKYVVVFADGNKDGYFTKQCQAKKIPLTILEKVADLTGVIQAMFGLR